MFKLINSCLNTNSSFYTIDRPTAKLEVITNLPISSVIECEILGLGFDYKFPLIYNYSLDEGNVFGNIFLIDDKVANYIRTHPNNEYKFRLIVNNKIINNEQKLRFSPKVIANYNNMYYELLKEIAYLKQDLLAFRSSRGIRLDAKVSKGMVPVSTGNKGEYIWDYVNGNIAEQLKSLADVVKDLVDSNSNLSDRLIKIEENLTNYMYKEYDI